MVSASHGAMDSLLGKLGDLLTDKYKLLKEAKREIRSLRCELDNMYAFLKDMSAGTQNPNEQAKCWMNEVRELSYDIDDSVDEFMLRVEQESSSRPQGFKGFIDKYFIVIDDIWSMDLELNPTLEGMRQILSLSYTNLPHCLKTCVLYLGMYPEDHTISKSDLVRQWVAQGFISKAPGQDPEDIAVGYFNEIVNRSIIQPAHTDSNNDVLSCRVHDMMLDLIIHKCREENFVTASDDIQDISGVLNRVRRLSLHLNGAIDDKSLGAIQLSHVRALTRFGTSTYMPPLVEFKHLRVLNLEFSAVNRERMTKDLTRISSLFQLRYLKIVTSGRIELPSKISGLQQLETLEIEAHKVQIPPDVVHLRRLLHLMVDGGTSLPRGMGSMKSIRTLRFSQLHMSSTDTITEIGDLTNLRDLQLQFNHIKAVRFR
ncbi:hypothetical protein HU200_020096 [Digitaria exilis]|uniref:Rx N-terminal domain-containing protein n=1 Tax=Digitaria exilis TaxID=1010633 RepID=A0A835F1C3_9POAL|nr:hypothetical protein HU200_020096 [Digitaria exilis]